MSVLSWVKVAVCLWLLRKAVKVVKWLLIVAVAVAAWPVTVVAGVGYAAAWLRGWPSVRLRRAAASALPMTAVWVLLEALRQHELRAFALAPVRDWQGSWDRVTGPGVARTFLSLAPLAVPAGLVLARGCGRGGTTR